jgi:precorrin-6B methylase 2
MAQTLTLVLVVFVLGIHDAEAQRFRGGMRGGNRSGAAAQISIRSPQVGIRSPQVAIRTPQGFSRAGRFIVPRTPATLVRIGPTTHGLVRVAPVPVFVTPVFVTPVAPFSPHFRPPFVTPFFPRRSRIVVIDVPGVIDTTVVTQAAPGLTYIDQASVGVGQQPIPGRLSLRVAPFDPTPQPVVERMLTLAEIKKGDVVYDLGSGDGRVVIAAAKKFGVKAVGFEIDPGLVKLARENARKEGVEKLVQFRQQDFMTADLSPASVVTLYLSNDGNLALKPALMSQLKPGARIVSYGFDMGDWAPKIMEAYRDAAGDSHLLYLWQIAEPIASSDHSSSIP